MAQSDAFQPNAFQSGGELEPYVVAFQPTAFESDAFQEGYSTPAADTGARGGVFCSVVIGT